MMKKYNENIKKELNEIKEGKLIKDFKINIKNELIEEIIIIILEGEELKITLAENYCYKVDKNNKIYESFESLLNDLSEKYVETFWNNIAKGLKKNKNINDE